MENLAFRALCPDDIPNLRVLCGEAFPIDYPDSWYDFVTRVRVNHSFNLLLD